MEYDDAIYRECFNGIIELMRYFCGVLRRGGGRMTMGICFIAISLYSSLFLFSIKVLDGNYEKPTLLKDIFILNIIENKIKELLGAKLLFTDCFAPSPVEALE